MNRPTIPAPQPKRICKPGIPSWTFLVMLMVILFLLLLASCSKRVITNTNDVKDSIHIQYIPREVKVEIPGDTVEVVKWIECDSITNKPKPFTIKKKSGRSTLNLKVKSSGELTASSECDSIKSLIPVMDKEIFRLRHESKKETELIPEYKTRGIDKFCRWFTGIATLGLIAFAYIKIKTGLV